MHRSVKWCHQSSHLRLGFIGESSLQPKCLENSWELETVPMTRKRDGLWGSVITPSWELSGVRTEHHTFSQEENKNAYFTNNTNNRGFLFYWVLTAFTQNNVCATLDHKLNINYQPATATNLGKTNKEELTIRHSQSGQRCLLSILLDPVHVGLQHKTAFNTTL